ncbi:hypothetical protein AAG906_017199 [Vitis piasezkii]
MWVFRAVRLSLKHFSLSGSYGKPMFLDMHKASKFYCCIGQLADNDFILFFKRAKAGLKLGEKQIDGDVDEMMERL